MNTPARPRSSPLAKAALALLAAGLIAVIAGFVYDVLFAGIPYQDPPPGIAAEYARHSSTASGIRWAGAALLSAGVLTLISARIARPHGSVTR
ncbi:MAG: hypothetical protein QUS11_05490 [Candidatus Fermentibacter sp.]|nr:hypothetical protein [Candidatus Fermentibacter sp.]